MSKKGLIKESFYKFKDDKAFKVDIVRVPENQNSKDDSEYFTVVYKDGHTIKDGFDTLIDAQGRVDDVISLLERDILYKTHSSNFRDFQ